jgi:integrase
MDKGITRAPIRETRALLGQFGLDAHSTRRFDEIAGRFENFVSRGFGIEFLDEVTLVHVSSFVQAKANGSDPATATMHLRRSALRVLFRVARQHFGLDHDPARDLVLPPRSVVSTRPLTNDEVLVGRSFSLHSASATRLPAAWALGEATATTAELSHITTSDLDLDHIDGPRVWLHGSSKRTARFGLLDDWGATQLERRASSLRGTTKLIYNGRTDKPESIAASCVSAISDTLARCGLNTEPDVRPASLPAWAGTVVLRETDRIEEVARRLGMTSLDGAAAFVSFDWQ